MAFYDIFRICTWCYPCIWFFSCVEIYFITWKSRCQHQRTAAANASTNTATAAAANAMGAVDDGSVGGSGSGWIPKMYTSYKMYLSQSTDIFYDHYQLKDIAMKWTCTVCSRMFSRMGDFKWHMTSVNDETHYPCQCGKVLSRKNVRLCHQRTCPK